MNFSAYIERQKNIIRSRREGSVIYNEKGFEYYLSETEKLFSELNEIKGLNTAERMNAIYGRV